MILFDVSQIIISVAIQNRDQNIDDDLLRHMFFNTVRYYINTYKKTYGEPILACDSRQGYWRRDVFPNYKITRKRKRDKQSVNWDAIFSFQDKIKEEIRKNFMYKLIEVPGAEADDVIATLVTWSQELDAKSRSIIISSDKDYFQLLSPGRVVQFSPMQKKMVKPENQKTNLFEHILRGDSSDNIPNILSPDNTYIETGRARQTSSKNISTWISLLLEDEDNWKLFCSNEDMKHGYSRNKTLIDFSCIPSEIRDKILLEYSVAKTATRNQFLTYMIQHRMKELIGAIQEF